MDWFNNRPLVIGPTFLDGNGLAVGAAYTIGLTLGGLDHKVDAAVVGQGLVQLEGEGLTQTQL